MAQANMTAQARKKAASDRKVDKAIRKASKPQGRGLPDLDKYLWEMLAFLLPLLFFGFGLYRKEMHPFGEQQFLVTDLWHQYYPFFQILQEKLTSGGSLLYSWRTGIGTNFLALMAYYAASPLNLLSVFMQREDLRDGLLLILALKFSFAGFFMARFLKYAFGRNDVTITMFGVMYALCSYMMGYYWNIIWIDTVALLPLVILGLTKLVREGKYRTYVIALALSLISSYYIGYMVCIYTVLAFLLLLLYENVSFKKLPGKIGAFAGSSLLGGGLGAWILLPALFGLMLTHSANNKWPTEIKWYESWKDILANMLSFTEVTSKEGLPNLYCGLLPVLLIGAFLLARKIRIREKITAILMLVFLLVSCNMNYLNYIWHGLHFPNMLPYRFSFLFSFTLLVLGFRALTVLLDEKLSLVQWAGMTAVGAVFIWIGYQSEKVDESHKFALYSAILGGGYLVILFLRMFAPKQVIHYLLAAVMIYEMGWQGVHGVQTVGSSGYTSYPSSNAEVQTLIETARSQENELFYRSELTAWYTLNDPSLYYYDGVSQFSSMANESVTTFLRLIGLPASEAGNRYYYANTSPLTNMLLDVQYIMAKDGYNADTLTQHQIGASGSCTLYRNDYSLGFGFLTDPAAARYDLDTTINAFDQQNILFKRMTGLDKDLFVSIDVKDVGHTGYQVVRKAYGDYSFTRNDDAAGETYLKYNFSPVTDAEVYAYMKVTEGDNMDVWYDGNKVHRYNIARQPYITPVGQYPAGSKVTLRCDLDQDAPTGTATVYFYQINEDVHREGYEILKQGQMTLTSFKDTRVAGTVDAAHDGSLYLSIPYEPGWSATVDGVPTEIVPMFGAMCSLPLTAGHHEIVLKYAPKGFMPGMLIMVGSLGMLVLLFVLERRKKAAKTADKTAQADEAADDTKSDAADETAESPKSSDDAAPTEDAASETPADAPADETAPQEGKDEA